MSNFIGCLLRLCGGRGKEETESSLNLLRHKNISEEKRQRMTPFTEGFGEFNAAKLPTAPSDDHTESKFVQDPDQQMEKLQIHILKVC